jgi:hypothetical protein
MISANISKQVFYQGNIQATTLEGLIDKRTGNFLNDWTNIVMTLVDDQGQQISGCVEIPMTYLAATNGNYQGVFGDNQFYPDVGTGYKLLVDGSNAGATLHLELAVEIKPRQN